MELRRHVIQLLAAALYNLDFGGIATSRLNTGPLKHACVPGLNCHSCPGAVAACPLGALQTALVASNHATLVYVAGLLLAFGALLGRSVCGWACPFGLAQDLLDKIPLPKLRKGRWSRRLSWLKYAVLAVLVVALPIASLTLDGVGSPAFCQLVCPVGTLEAGIPLLAAHEGLRQMAGGLFWWKVALAALVVAACLFVYRPFCRFVCPLGALYSFFSRFALLRWTIDEDACTHCGACVETCRVDVRQVGDRECIACGACAKACPTGAVRFSLLEFARANGTLAGDAPAGLSSFEKGVDHDRE